jgi:hypothetical protein
MKKLFATALIAISLITTAFATETKISYAVLSNFKTQFKNASDINWTITDAYTKATFVENQVKMEAFFSPAGELIGSSKGITLDQLSVKAKRNFAKKFGEYAVTEAIRFEGVDESAYFIAARSEKETVVVKVNDDNIVTVVKREKL